MSSRIPEFLDALVPLVKASSVLRNVQVEDGLPTNYARPDCVALGISTEDVSVESERANAGMGARRRERIDVMNVVRSWTGDANLAARRTRAFELVAAVEAVLLADPTVGGVVDRARVVAATYLPARTAKEGTGAFVEFRIQVDAFTT